MMNRQQYLQKLSVPKYQTIIFWFGLVCIWVTMFLQHQHMADAFIFWKAKTTACDTCDGIDTYSGRNVMCCFLSSKCCGYESLDEAEAIRANMSNTEAITK